jgi:hypothetical protein
VLLDVEDVATLEVPGERTHDLGDRGGPAEEGRLADARGAIVSPHPDIAAAACGNAFNGLDTHDDIAPRA